MPSEVNFLIGGEAGQGVQTVGFLLSKTFARGGYYVFADQDYESRVRGGHNFFRARISTAAIGAICEPVDILIALNKETIDLHRKELTPNGVIIFDGDKIKDVDGGNLFGMPLEKLAETAGDGVMENTVALGAALGLLQCDPEILDKVLFDTFGSSKKGEGNVRAARAGYTYIRENYKGNFERFNHRFNSASDARRMLLDGNQAISLGAIAAGCKFVSAYPMTPTTSIMEFMAEKSNDFDLVVVQPEDEISAVNMAIGASYAGVRAMTATSGSGFCLMVEGLGLAGITETPLVIVEGQRPGPAVGLPTRTEQGDLEFMIHAHQSEFPRAVLAPATVEDCFWATVKAFNLAEKYQIPVIVLTDQYLATTYATVNGFDLSKVNIERGKLYSPDTAEGEYKRHVLTQSGISPRAFPGTKGVLVVTDSDEHNESGHLIEDAKIRSDQVQKRMRKLFPLKNEISPPLRNGPKKADITLVGWGSTYGAIREAMDILHKEKLNINHIHLNELWPFPAEAVADALSTAKDTYVIENNATGQLAHLIRAETGKKVTGKVLKFDGRPFTPAYIARQIKEGGCECDDNP